jgi:ribosomal protein S11
MSLLVKCLQKLSTIVSAISIVCAHLLWGLCFERQGAIRVLNACVINVSYVRAQTAVRDDGCQSIQHRFSKHVFAKCTDHVG